MTKDGTLPRTAILIVNAASRSGKDAFANACDKLKAARIELFDAVAVDDPEKMGTAVRDAVGRAPMVIVGGGDGSLSSNIRHFIGRKTVFALLPLGTANSFARTMGIPLDLDGAIEVIATGEARRISLGCIDGHYFLNAAALGLAPKVAETVPHGLKRRLGRLGYLMWAGWSAASFNAFRVLVEVGGRRRKLWATEVRIANGRFHGGVELIESADPERAEIVVQVVRGRSVVRLGLSYVASALKLARRGENVREFRGRKLRLTTRPPMAVSIDGELGPDTPLEISVVPDAVVMAAPSAT